MDQDKQGTEPLSPLGAPLSIAEILRVTPARWTSCLVCALPVGGRGCLEKQDDQECSHARPSTLLSSKGQFGV